MLTADKDITFTLCIMCVQYSTVGGAQYRGGVQYGERYHDACFGYLEYRGGFQYHEGYHEYRGRYLEYHGGYLEYHGGYSVLWGIS